MTAMTWDKPDLQGTLGVTEGDTKVRAIVDYYAIFDLTKRTEDQQNGPSACCLPGPSPRTANSSAPIRTRPRASRSRPRPAR